MTTTLSIEERGTMLTDYFCGTSGVMLPISVDNKTTNKQLLDDIEDEINQLWEHIEYVAEYHDFKLDTLEYHIAEQLAEMEDCVRKQGLMYNKYNANLDYSFEDTLEDEELPVAIFTIEFNKEN